MKTLPKKYTGTQQVHKKVLEIHKYDTQTIQKAHTHTTHTQDTQNKCRTTRSNIIKKVMEIQQMTREPYVN